MGTLGFGVSHELLGGKPGEYRHSPGKDGEWNCFLSTGEGRSLFPQQAAGSFSCLLCQVGIDAVYVGAVPI